MEKSVFAKDLLLVGLGLVVFSGIMFGIAYELDHIVNPAIAPDFVSWIAIKIAHYIPDWLGK